MLRAQSLCSALLVCTLLAAPSALADSTSFILGGADNFGSSPIEVKVTVDEVAGDLKFTLEILSANTGNTADLRGFFFDVSNESLLGGLSATGADVTDQQFLANSVIDLGNGANLNGDGNYMFDAGIEIGTQGIGGDDIQTTMFTVSHTTEALSLSFLDGFYGVRATSVGPADGAREGSAKVKGPGTVIPTPAAAGAGLLLLGVMGFRRRLV